MKHVALGMLIGAGLTLGVVLIIGYIVQGYLDDGGVFRHATIADFMNESEGR